MPSESRTTSQPTLQNAPDQDPVTAGRERPAEAKPSIDNPEHVSTLVCELLFNQLQHVSLVGMAAAGGILTLLGTTFADAVKKSGAMIAIVAFGLAAFIALMAQNHMVEALAEKKAFMKSVKRYRATAYALLGAGVGAFVSFIANIVAA